MMIASFAAASEWYVSTTGSGSGDGTINNPWDILTAFGHPASVQPGDTIWLRGGTYTINQSEEIEINGTSTAPIKLRQYPGERATIDTQEHGVLYGFSEYLWMMDFEIMSSATERWSDTPHIHDRGYSLYLAPGDVSPYSGMKVINLVVHDTASHIGLWEEAANAEAYGNLIYYNGCQSSDRGHGHAIYTQNGDGRKVIKHNVMFGQYGNGLQVYGSGARLDNYDIIENVTFNAGNINTTTRRATPMTIGGGDMVENTVVEGNHMWFYEGSGGAQVFQLNNVDDIVLRDNRIAAIDGNSLVNENTTFSDVSDNYFLGATFFLDTTAWPDNVYHRYEYPQSSDGVFVYPNAYDSDRALIVVWNGYAQANSVSVDLSSVLNVGDDYEIYDSENFYGSAVATGTYGGSAVSLPVNQTAVQSVIGTPSNAYQHTSKAFGAYLLFRTSGSSSNLPPAITTAAAASPEPVTLPNTSTLTVSATDPDSGPNALVYTWSVVSGPGSANFSPNGTTAASTSTATFATYGTYDLRVTVSDGQDTITSDVSVRVFPVGGNTAPTIDSAASADPNPATMPNATTLSVTASDPDDAPAPLSYTWSMVSGPGTVTFDPNESTSADTTSASFSSDGSYTLRVTVSDGSDTVTSDVNVTVDPATATTIHIEAEDYDEERWGNSVGAGGTGLVLVTGTFTWAEYVIYVPVTTDYDFVINALAPSDSRRFRLFLDGTQIADWTYFNNSGGQYVDVEPSENPISLTVGWHTLRYESGIYHKLDYIDIEPIGSGGNQAPQIDTGAAASPSILTAPDDDTTVSVTASDPDLDTLTYTWSKVSGPGTVSFSPNGTTAADTSTATFGATGTYDLRVTVSDGELQSTSDVQVIYNAAANQSPSITTAAAASPSTITLPDDDTTVTVTASDPDSGPDPLSYTWSKVSGPGTVSFDPNGTGGADESTATFSTDGSYTLRVSVTDGVDTVTSDVSVTVNQGTNQAPSITTAAAADPSTVTLPNTSTITVTASDPDSGPELLDYTWSKVSGPGTVSFDPNGTPASDETVATFGASGSYTLRVTVSDGADSVTSDVTVTVNPAPNQAPTIDTAAASSPTSITLPTDDTTLTVVASDPDSGPNDLTYTWSKVSGSGTVSFSPNGTTAADTTTATYGAADTYTLRVTVSDGEESVTSDVSVTVSPSTSSSIHIEAEDYDDEYDMTIGSGGTGQIVTTDQNSWAEYEITVPATGNYNFTVSALAPGNNRRFRLLLDGTEIADYTFFDYSYPNYIDVQPSENPIALTAGTHTLRLESAIYFKYDYIDIDPDQ